MAKTQTECTCTCCGSLKGVSNFYLSFSEIFDFTKKLPICKDCIVKIYDNYIDKYKNEQKAVYQICQLLNIHYDDKAFEGAKTQADNKKSNLIQTYIQKINSLKQYNGLTFTDTIEQEEKNEIKKVSTQKNEEEDSFKFTDEDKKSKDDVIKLLGYEVFSGYSLEDQKYLYNELVPYLDEDTLEDPYKISVILQIVSNTNQIRKTNVVINKLGFNMESLVANSKEISNLTDITTKLNQQNDKLSKENNIALKHRGGSNSKNSTLGSMMKNLRELGFEKAEHDYYDISKAYGMKFSADISNKSLLDILHIDDNDLNNMLKMQRDELQKLQEKELDYREQIRKLVTENNELKKNTN